MSGLNTFETFDLLEPIDIQTMLSHTLMDNLGISLELSMDFTFFGGPLSGRCNTIPPLLYSQCT